MDEADLLGDRVAIMAEGVVKCVGSSLFLKSLFGVGYHMTMVKRADCNVDIVTSLVQSYVTNAKLESNVSAELSYVLPKEESHRFEELFYYLENNKDTLGIQSFGVSVTTMEEVFMKVSDASVSIEETFFTKKEIQIEQDTEAIINHENGVNIKYIGFGGKSGKNRSLMLYVQQFYGMFVKRVIHSWRNRVLTLTQVLVPIVFALIASSAAKNIGGISEDPPSLVLNLAPYKEVKIPIQTDSDVASKNFSSAYQYYLSSQGKQAEPLKILLNSPLIWQERAWISIIGIVLLSFLSFKVAFF